MTANQSPLFEPALWDDGRFKILDETLLPWKMEYIEVREVAQALEAVRSMKTRAFGQVLTFFYAAALAARSAKGKNSAALKADLAQLAERFVEARPTFDFKGLAGYFWPWFDDPAATGDAAGWIEKKIHELVATIFKAREHRAKLTAELLPDPCRLLTHCNVSGELVAVARHLQAMGKKLNVIATETRPYLQGSRLTAWELAQAGVKVDVIPDCAIAQVTAGGEIDAVVVGADRVARNGDIINKVGTYPIAVIAGQYAIPFYALVQDPGTLESGAAASIEERPVTELFHLQGRSVAPEWAAAISGRYPAFDVTPAALISRLIAFDQVYTPEAFRGKFQRNGAAPQEKKVAGGSSLLVYGVPKRASYAHLAHALKAEQSQNILVPEMRPELRGLHVVARQMSELGVPFQIISDNMMGTFFAQGQIRRLYLFYAELNAKGPAGISGSLLAVLLARAHGVPVELLAAESSETATADRDVSTFMGEKVSPDGAGLYPLEREILPWSLFKQDGGR